MAFAPALLYESLLHDIRTCHVTAVATRAELEHCFQVAVQYASKLEEEFLREAFMPVDEQIHYYKNWKPRFASVSAYYSLCYYMQVFMESSTNQNELNRFKEREGRRLEKFIVDNIDFYKIYKSGVTLFDAEWFLADEETCKNYVGLITTLLSLERYAEFLAHQPLP